MSKQTAVEWLISQIPLGIRMNLADNGIDFQQALVMEKEQIVDAHFEGQCDNTEGYPLQIAKQYYKETYEGGEDE